MYKMCKITTQATIECQQRERERERVSCIFDIQRKKNI